MRHTFFIFVFLVSVAMTCNKTIKFAQYTDIKVTPNPIPVEQEQASFDLDIALPLGGPYRKIDSIGLEVMYDIGKRDTIIGTSILRIPHKSSERQVLEDSKNFKLTNFKIPEENQLNFQMIIWKNGKSRTTDKLAIGRFVSVEDER